MLKCGKDRKQRSIKNNTEQKWEEVVQIFKDKKKRRKKRQSLERKKQFRYETMLGYVSRQTEKLYPDTAFT